MATEKDPSSKFGVSACVSLGSSHCQCHSRFSSVDVPSPMVHHQGTFPLLGRLMPGTPNPHCAPRYYAYGAPNDNRGLPVFQGAFRPLLSSSLSSALPLQRCRDFEEQGYCLRGDMCPMEHGENRIVVEDVQSLAQFDLRSSILSANMPGTSGVAGPRPRPLPNVTSMILSNDKGPHSKGNGGITGEGLVWNSGYPCSTDEGEADIYDPDEPLFLLPLKSDEAGMRMNDVSAHCVRGSSEVYTHDKTNGTASENLPHWRRLTISGSAVKEKTRLESDPSLPRYFENEATSESHFITSRSKSTDPSLKTQDDATPARKKNKKAERTLFVTGIPQQNNTMQSLLSHFRRFGVVTHIHIPEKNGRAFIQFSTREEAETALRAPDAVMGNRFIKLFWANRDNVLENAISGGSSTYMTSHGQRAGSGPCHASILNRGKENIQHAAAKAGNVKDFHTSSLRRPREIRSGTADNARVLPPLKKKLASVEQLKEELRKKREMLDQKQKDFKWQLEKLEKQVAGVKGDVAANQSAKRQKAVSACDIENSADLGPPCTGSVPVSYNAIDVLASSNAKVTDSKKKSAENAANPKTNLLRTSQEPTSFTQPICHIAPPNTSLVQNKNKLDACRTAFKIIPPLPSGLANVAALKEHFSSYGELSHVELENVEVNDGPAGSQASKTCSACIRFTTRESAQRAFMHGKCWKGHYMQFLWLKSDDNVPPAKEVSDPDELLSHQHAPISSHATTATGNRKF